MKKCYLFLNLFRLVPSYLIILMTKSSAVIKEDMIFWKRILKKSTNGFFLFSELLLFEREFRNLVAFRLKKRILQAIFKIMFPGYKSLIINTDKVGEKLYIQHGFSTIIAAESIGSECWINQQVTIGYEQDKKPTIGNHVKVCAGAIIIGDVIIGDNSIIAAGAVVTKDVPPNQIWGGVPAGSSK